MAYDRKFQLQLLKGASSQSKTYAAERRKQQEDDAEKALAERGKQAAAQALKDQENANPINAVGGFLGDTAKNVGNFVKDAAVDIYKTGESAIKGNADVFGGQVGADKLEESTFLRNELNKQHNEKLAQLVDVNNPADPRWDSPEVKKANEEFQKSLTRVGKNDKSARGSIEQSSKVDTNKVAADTAETFLNVATAGTGVGIKSAAKQAGKQILTKQGAGSVVKAAGRGAAEGAVFGGATGVTDAISEKKDANQTVAGVVQNAAFGGIVGGASSAIGKGLKNRTDNKAIEAGNTEVKAAQSLEAEQVAAQEAKTQLDAERPFNELPDEEIDARITQIDEGAGTGDVEADYATRQSLLNEKQVRQTNMERDAFTNNGLPNDVTGAEKALTEFDNGTARPDSVYKTAEPVDRAAAVLAREDIPVEIKNAAEEVVTDRNYVNNQLDGLMSPDVKASNLQRMDYEYEQSLAELDKRFTKPSQTGADASQYTKDARYIEEKRRLDEAYQESRAELDLLEAEDAPKVEELQNILTTLERRDLQITNDVNRLMTEAPDRFKDVDGAELQAQRQLVADNLEQAKRFNEPAKVVNELANTPDPVATYDRSPEVQEAAKVEAVEQVQASPDIADQFKSKDQSMVTLLAMSPSQVLESRGLRGGADNKGIDLHANVVKGLTAANKANEDASKVLTEIKKALPESPEAQRQIVDYIEGKRLTLTGFDAKVADDIKGLLDGMKAELEQMGYKTLDDYFPHLFDTKSPQVQKLFKGKVTGEVKFGNLKERLSDSDDYSRDIMDVMSQYVQGFNRKKYLEPAIKPLADLKTQVAMSENEVKFFDKYVEQLMGQGSKLPDGLGKALGAQRMISSVATMGLNPGTAIRNMTQGVNTIAQIGPRYSAIGTLNGARMLATKEGREELARVGVMEGGISQNYFDAMVKPGVVGRAKKGADVAVKGMMSMIRLTDISLRAQAYAGAKALGKAKGLEGEALENFAIKQTVDTQFMTSAVDMPIAFNGQAVRSLTQLATFTGKQAGFLTRMGIKLVKGSDGKFTMKDAGSVLAAVATATAATELLKPVIGMRETEWIPFYDQVSGLWGDSGDPVYRSPAARLLFGDGKGKSGLVELLKAGDKADQIGEFINDNWSAIVPAGTQIKKSVEGYQTTETGVSRNDKGNIRYLQDMDVESQFKASLFGQYTTDSGRQWIKDNFPTLSEKQTETVDSQPTRELKEQYAEFYSAKKAIDYTVETDEGKAKGRTAVYGEVKNSLNSGDINKGSRIAEEYNAAVDKAFAKYRQENPDMPKELEDELLKSTYINVAKIQKNIEKE